MTRLRTGLACVFGSCVAVAVGLLGASLIACACAAPRPSKEPLGVGPLSPHYRLAVTGSSHARREDRTASKKKEKETKPETEDKTEAESKPKEAATEEPKKEDGAKDGDKKPETAHDKIALASSFLGDYRGDDVSTYRLAGMPEHADKDPNARVTVKSTEKTSIDVVLVDSSNGKDICTLNATLGETNATITPGQKCFEQNSGDETAGATVKTGTVTIEGRTLTLDLTADFAMHTSDQDVTGSLDYHFEGKRR